jgi:hypothetical protein
MSPLHVRQDNDSWISSHLSNIAYSDPSERQSLLNNATFSSDYRIDPDFNTAEHFAVLHAPSNTVYSAFRGTSNLDDAGTDLALLTGNLTSSARFHRDLDRSRHLHEKFAGHRIISTGHSLGGTIAETLSRHHGTKSIAFNPGTSPFANQPLPSADHQRHRIDGDFVSSFSPSTTTHPPAANPVQQLYEQQKTKLGFMGHFLAVPPALQVYNTFSNHSISQFSSLFN